jgi:hypothetical protein
VPITRARPVIRTQLLIPNTLGELAMMQMMPANAPSAMAVMGAGSVAGLNLSSMGGALGDGGVGGLKIRSILLIY